MYFDVLGEIASVETIAAGNAIRELARLEAKYGLARWRKLKGVATIRLLEGTIRRAEIHWYEAHGIGRREYKIKSLLD